MKNSQKIRKSQIKRKTRGRTLAGPYWTEKSKNCRKTAKARREKSGFSEENKR
jgi:hypothetical protein